MAKRFLTHILVTILLLTVFFCGCNRVEVGRDLKRMMSCPVVFSDIITINQGVVTQGLGEMKPLPKLVVFVDSTECSSCRIKDLYKYTNLYTSSGMYKTFSLVILFSPKKSTEASLRRYIENMSFTFPVSIDAGRSFLSDNPNIPRRKEFHTFLTDKNNIPVFVGDPLLNDDMSALFYKTINNFSK